VRSEKPLAVRVWSWREREKFFVCRDVKTKSFGAVFLRLFWVGNSSDFFFKKLQKNFSKKRFGGLEINFLPLHPARRKTGVTKSSDLDG
jgi:hypothetical protein